MQENRRGVVSEALTKVTKRIIKPCDGDSNFSLMTVFQEKYDKI